MEDPCRNEWRIDYRRLIKLRSTTQRSCRRDLVSRSQEHIFFSSPTLYWGQGTMAIPSRDRPIGGKALPTAESAETAEACRACLIDGRDRPDKHNRLAREITKMGFPWYIENIMRCIPYTMRWSVFPAAGCVHSIYDLCYGQGYDVWTKLQSMPDTTWRRQLVCCQPASSEVSPENPPGCSHTP